MASFAKIGLNNKVMEVVAVDNEIIKDNNGVEQEELGIQFLTELTHWPIWKQTSYNTRANTHILGGIPFRKNQAGKNYTYDEDRDAFIAPKPYPSWILDEDTCNWKAPIEQPTLDGTHRWNEENQSWDLIDNS